VRDEDRNAKTAIDLVHLVSCSSKAFSKKWQCLGKREGRHDFGEAKESEESRTGSGVTATSAEVESGARANFDYTAERCGESTATPAGEV